MERCIFIGYPAGYNAWKFYNPVTKRVVICECAEFDERYFPGLKHTWNEPSVNPLSPLTISEHTPQTSVVDSEIDDSESDTLYIPPTITTQSTPSSPSTPMHQGHGINLWHQFLRHSLISLVLMNQKLNHLLTWVVMRIQILRRGSQHMQLMVLILALTLRP